MSKHTSSKLFVKQCWKDAARLRELADSIPDRTTRKAMRDASDRLEVCVQRFVDEYNKAIEATNRAIADATAARAMQAKVLEYNEQRNASRAELERLRKIISSGEQQAPRNGRRVYFED